MYGGDERHDAAQRIGIASASGVPPGIVIPGTVSGLARRTTPSTSRISAVA